MRSTSLLLVLAGLTACQGAAHEAEGRVLPRMNGAGGQADPGTGRAEPGAQPPTAPARPEVDVRPASGSGRPAGIAAEPTAAVQEAEVIGWVRALRRKLGRDALQALPRGDNLVDRLRYCYAAVLLDQGARVQKDLAALRAWQPKDPVVLWVSGRALVAAEDLAGARVKYRAAYARARTLGIAAYPGLVFNLASLLLGSTSAQDQEEGETLLRGQLATGARPARAAVLLREYLVDRERHREALRCVDAALAREADSDVLRLLRADLCFSLFRWQEADELLATLAKAHPSDSEVQLNRFRVQMALGKLAAAGETLAVLKKLELPAAYRTFVQRAALELQKRQANPGSQLRQPAELFAVLRAAPETKMRMQALRTIIGGAKPDPRLVKRALRIAWNNEDATVRSAALGPLAMASEESLKPLAQGLADRDPRVRGTAAEMLGGYLSDRKAAQRLLLERLAEESDAYAFGCIHRALVQSTERQVALPFGAADSKSGRAEVRAAWREKR